MNTMRRDEMRRDANDCRELVEMGTRLVRILCAAYVSWGICLCLLTSSALRDRDQDQDAWVMRRR
jgi:hypothetical protein